MLRELENDVLILGDLDVSLEEVPLLSKFLTNKEALKKVKTLVVSKKFVNGMSSGRKATQLQTHKVSSLNMNKGKLQHAIIDFIAHSTSLDAILFDSVAFKPELYAKLGSALSNRKGSELRTLTFRQVPLGTSGLRALGPHLGRLPIQRLDLERCGLDDLSGPLIASLLKAQGARLDQLYWNSTLRLDPEVIESGLGEESLHVYSEGLVLLNLAGNDLSDAGVAPLAKQLLDNHWLMGASLLLPSLFSLPLSLPLSLFLTLSLHLFLFPVPLQP